MVGLDYDGVYGSNFRPEIGTDFIIVTGRTREELKETLAEVDGEAAIYLRPFGYPGDRHAAGIWKGGIVKLCSLTHFYEDDSVQAEIIKTINPNCKVMKVVNGKLIGEW